MAVLALDSHGLWILQNRFFLFFRVCHLYLLYPSLLQNNAIAAAIYGEKLQQA